MGTAKNTQQLAQDLAKQIAQEPLEILREAGKQVAGGEQDTKSQDIIQPPDIQSSESRPKTTHYQNELQDKAKSSRRMEALNQEIADIRKQDLFNDLQSRIPSRRFGAGQRHEAEKQQTRVEKPIPPSG
ncbi:MAG: hypothetical protein UU02_C0028G0009 [Candidatus Woesebacteria bacterium GW2011_GWA1_40_43]|uniref:Uncharacterized protein n=1 Tax=Candidatus Woesebacteria bacterium GW2011_GWA1_40_43 TaxID=1618553 RepID=A0A0G0VKI2_9BACT|nr:MAG: hypothetical protein UU02_C0028G0009 [Candidatus Woesebacteria bacterium GW2011_GWA1_40_43]